MARIRALLVVLAAFAIATSFARRRDSNSLQCQSTKLVVYKVTFSTFWSRAKFPKQYPEWRPPAQWSKLVGFSHGPRYHLFRLGETASEAVKEFAEKGTTEVLDKQKSQHGLNRNRHGGQVVFDGFNAPPIESGVGTSQASLFLDGNHTRVSLMSKIVPSPDWFVGLDSLNLCENGHFVDTVTVEADPIDAGTDNGLTFTSPNWPTSPPGSVFRITNKYPDHRAGSFNYPEKSSLPTIATFTFVKDKEYELSEVFNLPKKDMADRVPMTKVNKYSYQFEDDNNELDNAIVSFVPSSTTTTTTSTTTPRSIPAASPRFEVPEPRLSNEIPDPPDTEAVKLRHHGQKSNGSRKSFHHGTGTVKSFRSGYRASSGPGDFFRKSYRSGNIQEATDRIYKDKDDLYSKLLDAYASRRKAGLSKDLTRKLRRRRLRRLRHHKKHKKTHHRGPRHCKVGEWGEWSSCSKSCGIGESMRTREVVRKPKRGGNPCPPLKAMRWCGSARNCRENYFNW